MARRRRSMLWLVVVGLFMLSAVGFWVLLVPNNPLTAMFRGSISDTNGRVVTGPYPVRSDFRELRDHGVTTIVSLLDPRIPYERILLDQERDNAQRFGMKFYNFPMASVLGQRMGNYYQTDAELAAKTIDSLKREKVYLHCYLGVHRMTVVRDILQHQGTLTGSYTVRAAERSTTNRALDTAFMAYRANSLTLAIQQINKIRKPDVPALLLRAWSNYRLENIPQAKQDFSAVLNRDPKMLDACNGLGYCLLRENKLDSAHTVFSKVLRSDNDDPQAHAGIAMVEYRLGHFDNARLHLETSLASDSTNTDVQDLLLKVRKAMQQ